MSEQAVPPADVIARRGRLMKHTFPLPDGTRVEWSKATPEQLSQYEALGKRLAGER